MRLFRHKEKKQKSPAIRNFLLKISSMEGEEALAELKTTLKGLTAESIDERFEKYGKNEITREKPPPWYWLLLINFTNPFVVVLLVLGAVSYVTGDKHVTIIVLLMVVISVLMRFIQEFRSSNAAEILRKMVRIQATVRRQLSDNDDEESETQRIEIPLEELVPGDIIYLSAGDMIPADVRLLAAKDLFISQSALTGESLPVEKHFDALLIEKFTDPDNMKTENPLEKNNLCFMGTSVASGIAKAVVVATGSHTYFGAIAENIVGEPAETSFDKGVNRVTWLLVRFIVVMVPIIFIINGTLKGDWKEAFLFAIAVAVGLTPEMLPVIVTANLAKGALAMSRFKVIVKRLNSIQSFGAMDVLCTDKTGTLTQDKIILERYLNTEGDEDMKVLEYGFLNSFYQSGLKNMLDRAILDHGNIANTLDIKKKYTKIDEIPFDFLRKRMSVVLRQDTKENLLICKGAVEELLGVSTQIKINESISPKTTEYVQSILKIVSDLNNEGFRVIGIAYKSYPIEDKAYSISDETELIFMGLMAFLDPPKETAATAIKILKSHNVKVKVLTGDTDIITQRICREVNLSVEGILLGTDLDAMDDKTLAKKVEHTTIFAKLTPMQKARIVISLQANGHVVGFLGDGINDAIGLREADVGISIDTATDIARESADIILLEKSLLVLGEGVIKGREVYGNIIKYIKMTTSSNFGNVFSVLIASAFLPFLPMLPLQILMQNLFYDFSQLSIPWDKMDKEFLKKPRKWEPKGIARFMFCVGPISSIFDITTFLLLWYVFKANTIEKQALFHTGWFVEGLLSQTLVVHMIRTRQIPFFQSMASMPVIMTTIIIMAVGIYLPFSTLGPHLELIPLPGSYFLWLLLTLLAYCVLVQLVKMWYIKKFRAWL